MKLTEIINRGITSIAPYESVFIKTVFSFLLICYFVRNICQQLQHYHRVGMSFSLKYIGRKSHFAGKTLWEILGNLKDFGVGRVIVRNSYVKRFKEPCYMKILEVTTRSDWEEPKLKKYRPPNDLREKDVSVSF